LADWGDRCFKVLGFRSGAIPALSGDSGDACSPLPALFSRLSPRHPPFEAVSLQTTYLTQIDPWVTQRFPLGHPEFSTGSPKVFLGSPKLQGLSVQQRVAGGFGFSKYQLPGTNSRFYVKDLFPHRPGAEGLERPNDVIQQLTYFTLSSPRCHLRKRTMCPIRRKAEPGKSLVIAPKPVD
jgi:hypothetical protein